MDLDLRTRLLVRALDLAPGTDVPRLTPEQLERQRRRQVPHAGVAARLFGGLARGVAWAERGVPTRAGSVAARVYRPVHATEELPVVVDFHGGGWALGNPSTSAWRCSEVAAAARVVVVSVDYRKAPQHPHPAAVEDCLDAVGWVARSAGDIGGRGDRLAVMGASAGGNLAAVVSRLARDAGGPPIRHQVLVYPSTDATLSSRSVEEKRDAPVLPRSHIETYLAHYLSGGSDPRDPTVSPLLADDLTGLPEALVIVAEHDPLVDEGRAYAERLAAAGVPVRLTEYVGMVHGFLSFPGAARSAPQAVAEIAQELRRTLHG
jgi:acetyl esterase/lipase